MAPRNGDWRRELWALHHANIGGRSYWSSAPLRFAKRRAPNAHLLPNYDEYFIGFRDRSAFAERLRAAGIEPRTDALSGHILTIDGQIVGGWGRTFQGKKAVLRLKKLQAVTAPEKRAVGAAAKRLGEFLSVPTEIQ